MPIIISGISCPYTADESAAFSKAAKQLSLSQSQIDKQHIYKKSIDARKQSDIRFVYAVYFALNDPKLEQKLAEKHTSVRYQPEGKYSISVGTKKLTHPVYIVGFGPAGIFAAYRLAQHGYRPIVFERGSDMETRCKDVENFWQNTILNPECNVQFGEGGAGTFSDGKLTTRISDERCSSVLDIFKQFGASEEITYIAKPHIGTDQLRMVIQNIRNDILRMGGEVHFGHKLEKILCQDGTLAGMIVNGEYYETDHLVLAIGHSARDTFRQLHASGVMMQNKPFSVGVRIEHLQTDVNRGLYGKYAEDERLPQGEYQLSHHTREHCVYTFCMCPGGYVVPSASAPETVVTNGMSHHARNGRNANAAMVVSVDTKDYGSELLAGVTYQEKLERAAYFAGGKNYQAPAELVGNFLNENAHAGWGRVTPTYAIGVKETNLKPLFDPVIGECLRDGLLAFDRKIKGYAAKDAVMTGVETRTSSPVRILRNEQLESISVKGLHPCGEGAGYAGGIMSAAVDGLRVAEKIMSEYAPLERME